MTPEQMSLHNHNLRKPHIVAKRRRRKRIRTQRVGADTMGKVKIKTSNVESLPETPMPTRVLEKKSFIRRTFGRAMSWMTRRDKKR